MTAQAIIESFGRVIEAVGEGALTPGEGSVLSSLLDVQRRGVELTVIEARLAALEQATKPGGARIASPPNESSSQPDANG